MILVDHLTFNNPLYYELWRKGKRVAKGVTKNGITNQGKNKMLDCMFNASTPPSNWSIGIIDNAGYSALNASDVMNSHAGWVEWTDISGGSRIDWGQGAAAGQQVTNASVLENDMTDTGTLQGIFIVSDATLGGNIGILWATALFTVPLACESGDTLRLTYAIQL